ncbi:Zn-dependent hydrolase [Lentibacillus amyloliquefaciens]|uniref:Zn-dependent hydrolase n=1 Tax=Lentibacillus amyloliquefaciens TaxID=1472767 RepID=A0A0U4FCW0_9BACI|nr:Zn-dependent hydrolase [Lentibacillus amyloliquefaciens]ALX50691.1 Zn-dependent hydrolase [Lentibacillus amyloliquefaciens]
MKQQKVLINGERLQDTLEKFADFGRTDNNGVTRLALTEEDKQARNHFEKCCEELGMVVKTDDLGNIYAILEGIENEKPPVVIGSHLDSVKKGGRFDGVLGVLAGLEVVRTMVDHGIKPRISVMVVNFTNEEGARFEPSMMSSGILSGKFDKTDMMNKTDSKGVTFEEALNSIGYAGEEKNRLKEAEAFIEIHVEQGPVLEEESLSIGVVEGVMGMVCYDIEVTGESDHAGTTPMHRRKDALFATNNLITTIREKFQNLDPALVYTVGRMNVQPNIHTVIPNKVSFTIEARHQDTQTIKQVEKVIKEISEMVNSEGCNVKTTRLWDRNTVWFDENVVESMEQSTASLKYPYKRMVSGAGHDAQFIANYIPTGMIFVPSVNGKSHSEDELTTWKDCEKGVNVMLETVLWLSH